MLDHVFLTVSDIERSVSFYEAALAPLGINERFDFDGKNGPPGHPDLKGFGANGRLFLWLREALRTAMRHMSALLPAAGTRLTRPTQPQSQREPPTMAHLLLDSTMTRATTLPMCWTPMATASNSYTKVGSTRKRTARPGSGWRGKHLSRPCYSPRILPVHAWFR